jgi:hypothetical protein
MAVCSGQLLQQTCMLAPQPAAAAGEAAAASAAGDSALAGTSNGSSSSAGRVIARTFEYAVQTPVLPSQLSIAVGQFAVLPYAELLAAAGNAGVSLPAGAPIINVFALKDAATTPAAAAAADGSTQAAASQQPGGSRNSNAARNSSDGKGTNHARGSSSSSAAGSDGASHGLSHERLRLLADTLKPLAVLLRACDKVLNSSLPWGHLQVAVLPEALMLQPWQVGGC